MDAVIWHDLECGSYEQDLSLWLALAQAQGSSPSSTLARVPGGSRSRSHAMGTRLWRSTSTRSSSLKLERRAAGLAVQTVVADARDFDLPERSFALCVVPMQTIQLLGGEQERSRFLRSAARHLRPEGLLAIAITQRSPGI